MVNSAIVATYTIQRLTAAAAPPGRLGNSAADCRTPLLEAAVAYGNGGCARAKKTSVLFCVSRPVAPWESLNGGSVSVE